MVLSLRPSSTWIPEKSFSWIHRIGFYILKWGTVPKHVAFVMDGNRRFAKKLCVQKIEGHEKGFGKLTETLQWCLDMDIYEVTVYAFSIQNFKRSKDEVDALMDLAREKFRRLIGEWRKLQEHGICVRIIGNLTLLPTDLLILMLITMLLTKDNKRAYLNIAFPYIGKEEMANTSSLIIRGLSNGSVSEEDVNKDIFDQCLYTYQSPPPDLIIRTSGEHRISDFLSWQGAYSYVHFVDVLWPEFSPWNLMMAVFCYQHFVDRLKAPFKDNCSKVMNKHARDIVDMLQKERLEAVLEMCRNQSEPVDWKMVNSLSQEELYEFYKNKFSVRVDATEVYS